ncbi:MAG: sulfatase-like hydrolase/transferase [Gammaproteobacteria bacterium]|nr:sulfatase-like hydrolase/transferase [Gammaproteobacteria bacterium]
MSAPMNVLFITADQWRGDCLSSMGHPCLQTPSLDRLAADGVLFERHFAQATPCGPSRASLYTGMYLQNHRSVNNGTPLDARHSNVALEARKAGYDPALFGYTDVSVDPRQHTPDDPALRTYSGVLPGMTPVVHAGDHALPWLADLKAKGYSVPEGLLGVYKPKDAGAEASERGLTFAPALYTVEDNYTAFLTNELIKYLSVRVDEPWFVHLSYLAPHPPFVAPEPYHAMYDPGDVPKPVRAATVEKEAAQHPYLDFYLHNQQGWGIRYDHASKNNLQLNDRDVLQARATYYGMMSEVDFHIGRLLAFLDETGAYDDTMIVFTSDHGEQLGDHWQFAKYAYFDQSFHIPLIVRDPRAAAQHARGRRVSAFTENVDVMPTILDYLQVPIPSQCDGEALAPFCRGEAPADWRAEAHWEFDFRYVVETKGSSIQGLKPDQCAMNVIRGERYKYIHFTALPPLLFDLVEDPGEFRNLAEDPAYQPILLEQTQKMLSWRMNHDERVLANTRLTPEGVVERKMPRR